MNYIPGSVEAGVLWGWAVAGFLALLVVAAIQDLRTGEVANGIWLVAGILWMIPGIMASASRSLLEPMVFLALQQIFFSRFYGRADCHAFSCCGFYLWGLNQGVGLYLVHMLLSLLLMGILQLLKGNVNARGNLHTPVPFIPYIFLGFCGILVWIWH